jgi:hypothetical protein
MANIARRHCYCAVAMGGVRGPRHIYIHIHIHTYIPYCGQIVWLTDGIYTQGQSCGSWMTYTPSNTRTKPHTHESLTWQTLRVGVALAWPPILAHRTRCRGACLARGARFEESSRALCAIWHCRHGPFCSCRVANHRRWLRRFETVVARNSARGPQIIIDKRLVDTVIVTAQTPRRHASTRFLEFTYRYICFAVRPSHKRCTCGAG